VTALGVKVAAVVGLLIALWGWDAHRVADAHRSGEAAARSVAARLMTAETIRHAEQTAELRDTVDQQSLLRASEKAQHETDLDLVRRTAARGAISLRVPGACPALVGPADPSAAPAGRLGPAQDGTLLPATTVDVLDAAGGSAKDVRDYNALLDLYEEVRARLNRRQESGRDERPNETP
jgi:hypothetical protein